MRVAAKKKDGYILAYVLIVVMVTSLVAVAAYTTVVKNYAAQKAAVEYTSDKYSAEGAVELFVAELNSMIMEYAESATGEVTAEELDTQITLFINGSDEAEVVADGEIGEESEDKGEEGIVTKVIEKHNTAKYFEFTAEDLNPNRVDGRFTAAYEDDNTDQGIGAAYYDIKLKAVYNSAEVEVEIRVGFVVKKGSGTAIIRGVQFEYTSYNVSTNHSTAQEGGESDNEEE